MSMGSVVGANLLTGWPFLSTKNLVKFHLIALPKKPFCFSFKYLYNGMAVFPFTLIWCGDKVGKKHNIQIWNTMNTLWMYLQLIHKITLKCQVITLAKMSPKSAFCCFKWQTISSPSPSGIWPANWLHGNPNILNPVTTHLS